MGHILTDIDQAALALERDGFFVCKNFFPQAQVESARVQIEEWLRRDLDERAASAHTEAWYEGGAGTTILTTPTHLMLDAYGKSAALDEMAEKILTDSFSKGLLDRLVGDGIKLRGYNVQKMTGAPDPRPSIGISANPHEWHRDSLGEIGIAMFLEDVPGPGNGATSLVAGSHYFPYCPRWHALLGPPFILAQGKRGLAWFLSNNIFSKILGRTIVNPRATGAYGNKGDFYFFINDVWHGREPNIHGRTGIKVMIGAFSVQDQFPDRVQPPPENVLAKLPPRLRLAAAQTGPNPLPDIGDTILRRLRKVRAKSPVTGIFKWVRAERRLAEAVSTFARKLKR